MRFFKFAVVFSLFLFPISCGIFNKKQNFTHKKNANIPLIERYIREELQIPLKQAFSELRKQKKGNTKTKTYIEKYAATALRQMIAYGIPASITLAQGILESRSGLSELSIKSNNHFGIKCHNWEGAFVRYDDDALQECFRKYKNPKDSYKDHSLFLKKRKRYAFLFNYKLNDYKRWAKGLKKAGYATDKKYPQKLIELIKNYRLFIYDKIALRPAKTTKKALSKNKPTKKYHIVKQGETLYSIAKKYKMTVQELKKLNKFSSNDIAIEQKIWVFEW